jgi:hypothetical protein
MNLYTLKKVELIRLCTESNLDMHGTKRILRKRLEDTGDHWTLKYINVTQTKPELKVEMPPYPHFEYDYFIR